MNVSRFRENNICDKHARSNPTENDVWFARTKCTGKSNFHYRTTPEVVWSFLVTFQLFDSFVSRNHPFHVKVLKSTTQNVSDLKPYRTRRIFLKLYLNHKSHFPPAMKRETTQFCLGKSGNCRGKQSGKYRSRCYENPTFKYGVQIGWKICCRECYSHKKKKK